jgi:hypothetical protein
MCFKSYFNYALITTKKKFTLNLKFLLLKISFKFSGPSFSTRYHQVKKEDRLKSQHRKAIGSLWFHADKMVQAG